jgi:Reverse transcriptase (RNA-dependent DNA polymerase)/RNase H-like domain found in reverse transcriptase/Retroviral aspartyl protease/Integrase core domain/Integrase zinc binding domain
MCVLKGNILYQGDERPVRVLIDSGSKHEYVSADFIRKNSIKVEPFRNKEHWAQVADGRFIQSSGLVRCTLVMDRYRTRLEARVLQIPEYDVILGFNWLREANPIINWQELSIQVRDEGGSLCELFPRDPVHHISTQDTTYSFEEISPVTAAQADRVLRHPRSEAVLFMVRTSSKGEVEVKPVTRNTKSYETLRPSPRTEPTYEELRPLKNLTPPMRQLAETFVDVFREELPAQLPPSRDYEHTIDTGDSDPINVNAYPLSPIHIAEQSRQISQMLDQGLIQESSSPWGFPVLFVKKPGGKWRMCIDFRALNAVTKKNGYPLPRIQECLDLIANATYLSKIDLTQGYYQVRVDAKDREKTAFNTREGKFEYLAMPFGLSNAPATFQTLMNRILRQFIGKSVIVYLDDIVIYSKSEKEHLQHLTAVFKALRKAELYAKPSKCTFIVPELEFCGHMVGSGKLRPLTSKIEVIRAWPRPTTVHEVRQFLGLASYYRRFIRRFAQICVPLFELLQESDAEIRKKKFRKVTWNAQCEQAFRVLKDSLTEEPVLLQPDTTRSFVIETDASEWAIGCVLLQRDPKTGRLHPVAYDGRKLKPAELNYPVHEKELLAIKYALQCWRIYIDNGTVTTIYTDHESLKYLATMRNPTRRLARWIEEFGEYSLDIQYRKGSEAVVPDAISRRPDHMGKGPSNRAHVSYDPEQPIKPQTSPTQLPMEAVVEQLGMIRDMSEDEWCEHMLEFLRNGTEPPASCREDIYKEAQDFTIRDEELWKIDGDVQHPYIPIPFRADFLERMHSEYGHLAYPGILGIVNGRGWWTSRNADIRSFTNLCPQCQVSQRSRPGQERESPQTLASDSMQLFDRWAIDLIGPLTETHGKNRWIVTAIEYMTGWPVAKALPDARAETIARFLHDDIAMVYGPFKELLSDNGKNLVGQVLRSYTTLLGARHRVTTPYHPRTNGKVENFNGFLGSTLTKMLVGKPITLWDQYLSQALFSVRVRVHATSRVSPYTLLFGKNARLPSDTNRIRPIHVDTEEYNMAITDRIEKMKHARLIANETLVMRAVAAKKIRDEKVRISNFAEGDWVLVRAEARNKFEGRWYGPYQIMKSLPLGTYQIADPDGNVVTTLINGQRLITARVTDETQKKLWNNSKVQASLRKRGIELEKSSKEVAQLFKDQSKVEMTYDELASIPMKEWKDIERQQKQMRLHAERSGERLVEVGEEPSEAHIRSLYEGIEEALIRSQEDGGTDLEDAERETLEANAEEEEPLHSLGRNENPREFEGLRDGNEEVMDTIMADMSREDGTESEEIPKGTRTSLWQREMEASLADRERVATRYGLREKPRKTHKGMKTRKQ